MGFFFARRPFPVAARRSGSSGRHQWCFVPAFTRRTASFGLSTMRERADSVGGSLTIDTAPGKGTTVRFVLPS